MVNYTSRSKLQYYFVLSFSLIYIVVVIVVLVEKITHVLTINKICVESSRTIGSGNNLILIIFPAALTESFKHYFAKRFKIQLVVFI